MALRPDLAASFLFFLVVFSSCLNLSTCSAVKGKVSCLDCNTDFDLSGIKVRVKCDQVKKSFRATTNKKGMFFVKLPSQTPLNCLAKLLGGPKQLYSSSRQNTVSKITNASAGPNSYSISSPLEFSISCPSSLKTQGKCGPREEIGSSKTVDLPVPPEWGLAPTSYYIPFIPIIGIP